MPTIVRHSYLYNKGKVMETYIAECKRSFHNQWVANLLGSEIVKDGLGARIRQARLGAKLTQDQLAKRMGVSRPTITQWETGATTPHAKKLEELAKHLGLPRLELFGKSLEPNVREGPGVARYVPEISWVQAGAWTEVVDVQVDLQEVQHWPCPVPCSERAFCLRVEGDSMAPTFPRGMLIYVDPEVVPTSGRKVVAMCEDTGSATFKQYFEDGGQKYLKAMNPNWPEPYTPINPSCRVIGTVVFAGNEV